eukprot:m.75537 g.75537  ORF g.75537 m.75537 type:complete len:1711 (-) comp12452_c2_seq4:1262-6394(-)
MPSSARQLYLLLWKNFTVARRRPWATLFEIVLPIAFMCILVGVRNSKKTKEKIVEKCVGGCTYTPFAPLDGSSIKSNCSAGWNVGYYPNNGSFPQVMQTARQYLEGTGFVFANVLGTMNDTQMIEVLNLVKGCKLGIEFNVSTPTQLNYNLRFDFTPGGYNPATQFFQDTWDTGFSFPFFQFAGPRSDSDPGYRFFGFTQFQHAINLGIATQFAPDAVADLEQVALQRMPYPQYLDNDFIYAIKFGLPMLLMVALLFTALTIVRNIVHEKERKLKESMKMMGLKNWAHHIAWFVQSFLFLAVSCVIAAGCMKGGKVLEHSDISVIIVFLFLFATSSITLCFLMASLFSKASSGAAGAGIIWFCTYIPYLFLGPQYDRLSEWTKKGACGVSTTAMAIGAQLIGEFEARGDGVQWSTLNTPVTFDDTFSFGTVMKILFIDTIVYWVLAWYIECVFPGEFGIPQPWYFFVLPSFWCGQTATDIGVSQVHVRADPDHFEEDPVDLEIGVSMQGLRKVFDKKVAVEGTNLNMYHGQITALLGHNGAGKTTTMSMLTGLFPPSSGTAYVNGCDIRTNIDGVRQSLGICPQHDVLFDKLTVEEHLWFFCKLKGVDNQDIPAAIDEMIDALELPNKRDALSKTLSGGMKRKLSVAIAIVGGSKVVILDEPSSGVDPSARRAMWDLLTKFKSRCTMLLSTHFLDEADLLGDRIAIMSEGVVKCCGSSLFLKNLYGLGYHMIVAKEEGCNVSAVTAVVQSHIADAVEEANIGSEVTYLLPKNSAEMFSELFGELEALQTDLKIASFGVSVTTMEEVFLKVGEDDTNMLEEDDEETVELAARTAANRWAEPRHAGSPLLSESRPGWTKADDEVVSLVDSHSSPYDSLLTGPSLKWQQFKAMFIKRIIHSKRNWGAVFTQIILPMAFVFMALMIAKSQPTVTESPSRALFRLNDSYGDSNVAWVGDRDGSAGTPNVNSTGYLTAFTDLLQSVYADQNVTEFPTTGEPYQDTTQFFLSILNVSSNVVPFNQKNLVAANFVPAGNGVQSTAIFNNQAYHSVAEALCLTDATIIRSHSPTELFVTTMNAPLPPNTLETAQSQNESQTGFFIAFTIMFGISFLVSSFAVFPITERNNKAKHIQFVSGVDGISYWAATYMWDVINFLIASIMCLVLFAAFKVDAYSHERIGYISMLFVFYSFAALPTMYILSYLFDNPSKGYTFLTIANIVTGLAAMITVSITATVNPTLSAKLKNIFLFLPNYCFGQGISDLYNNYEGLQVVETLIDYCRIALPNATVQDCCNLAEQIPAEDVPFQVACEANFLSMTTPGIGRYLCCMVAEAFVFFGIVLMIEYKLLTRLKNWIMPTPTARSGVPEDEDVDVTKERQSAKQKVRQALAQESQDVLIVDNLSKTFDVGSCCGVEPFYAVDRLSFTVGKGDCFGLLGVNGAGKTTTFRMLTGDESMTGGRAVLKGFDVRTQQHRARQLMGYCPQFDGLIENLTGRELLTMYARLRGVLPKYIPVVVNELIDGMMLNKHADKPCGTYSGGNKRKLSTAVALCGPSPVLYLDEPTTGMDPGARRFLWNAILSAMRRGLSVVLTSHSMDEIEALCTKLAIMVNGQIKCIGTLQHLKSRFGQGLTLIMKCEDDKIEELIAWVTGKFQDCSVTDQHMGQVTFDLASFTSWSEVFQLLQQAVSEFGCDYSVSQTSLEEVFLSFAKDQFEDTRTD